MSHIETGGARIWWETAGAQDAPAILFIHAGVATARMWDPQWDDLRRDHRVVRYDTRGFGRTTTENVEFSDRADAVAVLDAAGVGRATIVSASRGGTIAIDTALEFPERVSGIVTVASAAGGSPDLPLTPEEDLAFTEIDRLEETGDFATAIRAEIELWTLGLGRRAEDLDPAFVARAHDLHADNLRHGGEQMTQRRLEPPAFGRLGELEVPALVTAGDRDVSDTLALNNLLVERIPGAEKYVFAGTAHLPSVEQPDEFTQVLRAWLARHSL